MTAFFFRRLFLCLSAFCALHLIAEAEITRDELKSFGTVITDCRRSSRGINVSFVTAHNPPYLVGVYPVFDFADAGYFAEVATTSWETYIPGDFTDLPVLVKVLLPSRVSEVNAVTNLHRQLTAPEIATYKERCRDIPSPDVVRQTKYRGNINSLEDCSPGWKVAFTKNYAVSYNGVSVTFTAAKTITFASKPVRGSAAGESEIRYWPDTTTSYGETYDPSSHDAWCFWSSNSVPQFLMYRDDGPMYKTIVTTADAGTETNVTYDAYSRIETTNIVHYVEDTITSDLNLIRGTVTSATSIKAPVLTPSFAPNYQVNLLTNTWNTYEFNSGWGLRPFGRAAFTPSWSPGPAIEVLWQKDIARTNTSNAVYLPRLFKGIVSDGPSRATTSYFGEPIVVTNLSSHWEADLGVHESPPEPAASNILFSVEIRDTE